MKHKTGQDRSQTTTWRQATRAVRGGTWRSEMGETSEALFILGLLLRGCRDPRRALCGQEPGMTYARTQNPTVMMLEERIALMEGSETCRVQASGMSAMSSVLLSRLSAGDHLVMGRAAFGPTLWMTQNLLPRFGIETTLVDGRDLDAWKDAIRPNTKLFFFETPANPTMDIIDIRAVSDLAHEHGIEVAVDNAFASSALQRPMDFGADVVAYSATKLMDGQGRVLAGAVCASHEWINKYLLPYQRNTGPILSPFNAWVVLKGLETLDLRANAQAQSALKWPRRWRSACPVCSTPACPATRSTIWSSSR
jgi:cystathionine beta-lyase/cystathionine gamma-synthase